MIESTSFWGLPLHTQRQRRRLVFLYYLLVASLTGALLWAPHVTLGPLLAQTLVLGGLLGGIRLGGPVKPYAAPGPLTGGAMAEDLTTLNLTGSRPKRFALFGSLDEREQHERDHAHFVAYRLLRWTVEVSALLLAMAGLVAPSWLAGHASALLWAFVVYLLSLPQAVLLWTEPSQPQADLIELRPA